MNKNVYYKQERNLLREQYSDLKKEKRVKKQIKIDEEYKESIQKDFIRKRSGVYRFRVIDVTNYSENCEINYMKTNYSLKHDYERLRIKTKVYENLDDCHQCIVFYLVYKRSDSDNLPFNETINQFLFNSEEEYMNYVDENTFVLDPKDY